MDPAVIGLIGALAGALITFASNYVLKRRDEGRVGGAAERRLRGELLSAYEVLEASESEANEAWIEPGLSIPAWQAHQDSYATRLDPRKWDVVNAAVDALARLWLAAVPPEARASEPSITINLEGNAPRKPALGEASNLRTVSKETINEVKASVELALEELDEREFDWLALQPWHPLPTRLAERGWSRRRAALTLLARSLGIVLAVLVAAAVTWVMATKAMDDDLDRAAVAGQLAELVPDADVINCRGDDGEDRWTCLVVTDTCRTAQVDPVGCGPNAERVETYRATGDQEQKCVLLRLAEVAAGREAPASVTRKALMEHLRGAVHCLGRTDPPGNLTAPTTP